MRTAALAFSLCLLGTAAGAQNTDIPSVQGLPFNFTNPGARALGMGGAFIGLADDATAAEANPAGLTILRKPEFSIEFRRPEVHQLLASSGTFPEIERSQFSGKATNKLSFVSFASPAGSRLHVAAYYHEALNASTSGNVFPVRDPLTGRLIAQTPDFFMPASGNGPVSEAECLQIRKTTGDPHSCLEYRVAPFVTGVEARLRTFGAATAAQFGKFCVGAAVRYQRFREGASTAVYDPTTFDLANIIVQRTNGSETAVTFGVGVKWTPFERVSIGAVYKKGPRFAAPTFLLDAAGTTQANDATFHVPDTAGAGVSVHITSTLIVNSDVVRVKYSNLTDRFVTTSGEPTTNLAVHDGTELHLGGEYFLFYPIDSHIVPIAVRAGYWRDPAHTIEWHGGLATSSAVYEAIYFPKGRAENHWSAGAGLAWPWFDIDAAYDFSKLMRTASVSLIRRF